MVGNEQGENVSQNGNEKCHGTQEKSFITIYSLKRMRIKLNKEKTLYLNMNFTMWN